MFQFMILLETFPPSPFGLKRIFEKVGKWKISRFTGKFSSTTNIPIDRILEDFSPFANVQIYLILLEKLRAKRSCPDGERAQCPSQSCEAECNWGGTCCWVGDGGCLFLAEKWRYMLLSENVHDTDDNF